MKELLFVFIGGGTGSVLRYLCTLFITPHAPTATFPWATLCINITGCLLIGMFSALAPRLGMSDSLRLMLTVGLCGGFTTFSTFANESLALLRNGNTLLFCLYTFISVALGIVAVMIGGSVGK